MEKIKFKIELLSKRIEIAKSKLLIFSAGIAGCWAFLSTNYEKIDLLVIVSLILIFIFGLGVTMNLFRFSIIIDEIKKLEKELNE
ncbi:hypothetical protein YZ82_03755 [Campylobacter hyointestinalis]|uniref:Uncharacterized protein n=1 Tax=Campylobacter hyointestinalis TaxID=198 RepID=A0A562XE82_CAMHY|nr:hypothetical protein [Campylobacter hyointestinalis]TWO20458.1 hypothetical protein YZ82_03755 [Campylobacter hyointestinalis]